MLSNPIILAALSGILPALLWLWFWLKEDNLHPEPRSRIALVFFGGMMAVIFALPLQYAIKGILGSPTVPITTGEIIGWAIIEEALKFFFAYVFALKSKYLDEPIDAVIYMITAALGFAALENTLFVFKPLLLGDTAQSIILSNQRFVGASLLHVVCSAVVGMLIGLAYYKRHSIRRFMTLIGLALAATLHTFFNLFIMEAKKSSETFTVFAYVWGAVIFLMLMFEKVKSVKPPQVPPTPNP